MVSGNWEGHPLGVIQDQLGLQRHLQGLGTPIDTGVLDLLHGNTA